MTLLDARGIQDLTTERSKAHIRPTGAIAETLSREAATLVGTVGALTSGQLLAKSIVLPIGRPISKATFMCGATAMAGATHSWVALVDASLNVLAKSADDTTATWTANTTRDWALSFLPTYTGLHYLCIVHVATTMPTYWGVSDGGGNASAVLPFISGLSTTGLTTPASLGGTIAALAGTARKPWAWVS